MGAIAITAQSIETMEAPLQEQYQDNWFERTLIWLFSHKIARTLDLKLEFSGYEGFVKLSEQIMRGRNATEQQDAVAGILKSLVPAPVLFLIRKLFSPTQLVCELNAWFATVLFEWLVGPCEINEAEVLSENGEVRRQKSAVKIKKCRYLESSGCVGTCINLCKLPTQEFFTRDFGIPLTMTPNFEDMSCEMVFGHLPPPLETEQAYHQACLINHCNDSATTVSPCPRVRDGQ